jgi:hypothetical protein
MPTVATIPVGCPTAKPTPQASGRLPGFTRSAWGAPESRTIADGSWGPPDTTNGRFPATSGGAAPFLYVRQDGLKRIGTVVLRKGQLGTDVTAKIQEGGWQFKTTNAAWVWPRTVVALRSSDLNAGHLRQQHGETPLLSVGHGYAGPGGPRRCPASRQAGGFRPAPTPACWRRCREGRPGPAPKPRRGDRSPQAPR